MYRILHYNENREHKMALKIEHRLTYPQFTVLQDASRTEGKVNYWVDSKMRLHLLNLELLEYIGLSQTEQEHIQTKIIDVLEDIRNLLNQSGLPDYKSLNYPMASELVDSCVRKLEEATDLQSRSESKELYLTDKGRKLLEDVVVQVLPPIRVTNAKNK